MKKILSVALALFAGLAFSLSAQDATTAALEKTEAVVATTIEIPTDKKISRIFVVGDSTGSPFNDTAYYIPRAGFGTKMQDYLNPAKAAVVNFAVSGRSSTSFISDSGSFANYSKIKQNIRKGDYLIIAFGHNDEKLEKERYTNPNGSKDEAGSFKNSLYENYIKMAKDVGATPVLVTPIVRYNSGAIYEGTNVHITSGSADFPGGDYPKAIRELGKEVKVTVVDQTANTKALYEKLMGDARKLHAQTGNKITTLDTTHLNAYGASVVAKMLIDDLAKKDKKFKAFVKAAPEPVYDLAALKNPLYVEPGRGAPKEKSTVFTTTDPWWASSFGEIGGDEKISDKNYNEIIETANGVTIHSGFTNGGKDSGKIASNMDGLNFYFQKLPVSADFTFTAKAKVLHIKKNNQVSFGAMVRDNVMIDVYQSGMNTNYAAAGALKITNDTWTAEFARIDTVLQETPHAVESVPEEGTVVNLFVEKKGNNVTVQYGKEAPVTYEIALDEADKDNIYVGVFTSRNVYVEFTNLSLKVK